MADPVVVHVLDTETCGKDPGPDSVVEAAVVPVLVEDPDQAGTARLLFEEAWESLVKPSIPITFGAMACHHVTPDMVEDAPTLATALRASPLFAGGGRPRVLCAHNAPFDRDFLAAALDELCAEVDAPAPYWLDTYRLAKHRLPDAEGYSNQSLRYELGLRHAALTPGAHRAPGDALTTALLLVRLLETCSLREACAIQGQPVVMKSYSFGKHRGQALSEVPEDYLRWVANKSDLGLDEKHTARTEIDRRWVERNKPPAGTVIPPEIPVTSGPDQLRASLEGGF